MFIYDVLKKGISGISVAKNEWKKGLCKWKGTKKG